MEAEMDMEAEFLQGLVELGYGVDVTHKLKKIAPYVGWARGWPEDRKAFWNAEAFMWGYKIERDVREMIAEELDFLNGKLNLDLGCGAYSYIPSVGLDISEKMLQFNENCHRTETADLEQPLKFSDQEFESVTALFVLNYVRNYVQLFHEIHRIIKPSGVFMMAISGKGINEWQRQKQIHSFSSEGWLDVLKGRGFRVEFIDKEKVWLFKCEKLINS